MSKMAADMPWDYKSCFANDPSLKESDITELRKWVEGPDSSSVIPNNMSDQMLLCFHSACNLVMEDTKKCIKTYYSTRDKAPELFDDRDVTLPGMIEAAQAVEFAVLPEKSDEGFPIIYHGLADDSPDKYMFNLSCKLLLMTIDKCLYEHGPGKGVLFLFDMRRVKLGHLTRVNLSSMAKFFTYIQEGMPVRIKKILIMNTVPFFDKVMMLMKPFMKKELVSLLNLYPPNTDMEAYYKDVLPKKCLPPHYGGDLPDMATLHKKNMEQLAALKPFFEAEEKHRYIYSKKSKKKGKLDKGFQDLNID